MTTATLTRPERVEELRIEAESRAAAGDLAYPGVRTCLACEHIGQPIHPDETDRQICAECAAVFEDPITWSVQNSGDEKQLVLRVRDHCAVHSAHDIDGNLVAVEYLQLRWAKLERWVIGAFTKYHGHEPR